MANAATANGEPLRKKKKEYDVELSWDIGNFRRFIPTFSPTANPPKNFTCEVLNSEIYKVHYNDVEMQWRICIHKETEGGMNPTTGIELHLVSATKTSRDPTASPSTSSASPHEDISSQPHVVPLDVDVTLHFVSVIGQPVLFSEVKSVVFQHSVGGLTKIHPAGLALLLNERQLLNIRANLLHIGDRVILKFGLNFNNVHTARDNVTKDVLVANLEQLLNSGNMSDYVIEVGAETFRVHKLILTMRCPYFAAMFNSGMIESNSNKLIVSDMQPAVMKLIIEYIYTSRISSRLSYDHLTGFVQAADLYQLNEAKRIAFALLLNYLDETNCGDMAVLGFLCNAELQYKTMVFKTIARRWAKLTKIASFKELVKQHPEAFLNPVTDDSEESASKS